MATVLRTIARNPRFTAHARLSGSVKLDYYDDDECYDQLGGVYGGDTRVLCGNKDS